MAVGCVIGVDLGGTKLLAGTVDADLQVHHRTFRMARPDDASAVIDQLVETIQEGRDAAPGEVLGVGLGVPGLVDPGSGVVADSNHLPLAGVALRDVLSERVGLPVAIDNDGNMAMLAESRRGAARGARDAVLLTIGTGIGGGLLVGGRIVHGARGAAGELGHMIVDADGPPCPGRCPNHGCLEALVSGHALGIEGARLAAERPESALHEARERGDAITGLLVTELALAGDDAARAVIATMGANLGLGIVTLANVFNPEVVVVGGGAIGAGELLLEPAREVVAQRALPIARAGLRIVATHFGAEAGMMGAACAALDAAGVGVA
ncbi:MAG: ROK family protein [Actinomycetota bacterium]|nr:ROK family protein [Actinomycetota bacterium]